MKKKHLLPLAAATAAAAAYGCSGKTDEKPNVIIILADDLGCGDVSALGSTVLETPNLDRMCQEGLNLTDGHSTAPTSTPSRYSLMTGLYPWRNRDAEILAGDANLLIREDQPTIAKMMKDAGYATAAIGKWHLGLGKGEIDWNKEITPNPGSIGFDYSYIIAATVDRVPTVYVENGKVPGLDPSDPLYVNYKENFPGEPTALTHPELMRMKWSDGHNCSVVNGIPRIGYQKGGRSAYWNDEEMADVFLEKVKGFISENKDRPFFPWLKAGMMAAPVILCCWEGFDAVRTVREMAGATNARKAASGTIRGDYGMSSQENIVHTSDSVENARIELDRFFSPEDYCEYPSPLQQYLYAPDEN